MLISFRNLFRNRVFVGINVGGLAIAVACSIIAYLVWKKNLVFDREHHEARRVLYRVNTLRQSSGDVVEYASAPEPLGDMLRENDRFKGKIIRYATDLSGLMVGDRLFDDMVGYVDPEFLSLFPLELIAGSPRGMQQPAAIFISEELAQKFFQTTEAIGKTIEQVLPSGALRAYEVAGVFRALPATSSFQFDAFVSYNQFIQPAGQEGTPRGLDNNLFITVENAGMIKTVERELQAYAAILGKGQERPPVSFHLDPFDSMAQRDAAHILPGTYTRGATPLPIVLALVVMSILILLIACFNLTNTLVALAARRLKEIGLRKVIGGSRGQLMAQFMGEAVLICFLAVLLALPVCDLMMAGWNELWPFLRLELSLGSNFDILLFMAVVVVMTGVVSGIYPAYYISRFQPGEILKGTVEVGNISYFNKLLLGLQFAASVLAIFFSVAFYQNARYQRHFALGFRHDDIFVLGMPDSLSFARLRQALEQHPAIEQVSGTHDHILASSTSMSLATPVQSAQVDVLDVGADYASLMGLRLLQGRDFLPGDKHDAVIITEDLIQALDLKTPLEQRLMLRDTVPVRVVGVMADIYNRGTFHPRRPMVLRLTDARAYDRMLVRARPEQAAQVGDALPGIWHALFPHTPYRGAAMNELMRVSGEINRNVTYIFSFLAITAILLSVAGLYATISLNIVRRTKEVGIRKVLGATTSQVMWSTHREFALILLLATATGIAAAISVVGWVMRLLWFYHRSPGGMTVLITSGVMLSVALALAGTRVYRAAQVNPVLLLRQE
ncbi:ABC transporter permease [Dawidia soli]|uniref:ABC transporter permease n=1 Tax=Dawidia soli TaxID=2782352 RepID=A0AAP2DBZ1_9BACT|nr:ABC transporter permease [Dawidia soli]MBT1688622.1 ABC transporter permease [Dawidia soli]